MTPVILTSPWIPAEWVRAHGMEPAGIWPRAAYESAPAGAGTCEFAQRSMETVERHPDSAFVFSSHCDQMRRAFDELQSLNCGRTFLFNLPATVGNATATKLFGSELDRLSRFLIRHGGEQPSSATLCEAIGEGASFREKLSECAPKLGGREFMELMTGLRATPTGHSARTSAPSAEESTSLALLGGPLPMASWPVLDMIERLGGNIVLKATEPGERNLWRDPTLNAISPVLTLEELAAMLARSYLDNMVDMFQRPNSRLYAWLEERLRERAVQGILLWHYTWCDLWRAEAQSLREAFGLPVLAIDASSGPGELPRVETRIEAFMESLR